MKIDNSDIIVYVQQSNILVTLYFGYSEIVLVNSREL